MSCHPLPLWPWPAPFSWKKKKKHNTNLVEDKCNAPDEKKTKAHVSYLCLPHTNVYTGQHLTDLNKTKDLFLMVWKNNHWHDATNVSMWFISLFLWNNVGRYINTRINTSNVHVSMPGMAKCLLCHGSTGSTGEWVVIFLRCHVPTAYAPLYLFPTSYRFTTRQMAVIWEVLRWAHFIALLMHSHKQPSPLLSFSFLLSFSLVFSLLLSPCLSSSLDQSLFFSFCLWASFLVYVLNWTNVPTHTHTLVTNSLSLESNSSTLKHLRSPYFFAFLIMHTIFPLLVNCTKWQLLVSNPVLEYAPGRQLGKGSTEIWYINTPLHPNFHSVFSSQFL